MAKKIGGVEDTKEKAGRAVFTVPVECLNEESLISSVPLDYNPFDFKPLKKKAFSGDDIFMDFRAHNLKCRAEKFIETADRLTNRAEKIRKFGDEGTRKAAIKFSRMREQLAKLEAELEASGVDLSDL